jgi:hypothetical protein
LKQRCRSRIICPGKTYLSEQELTLDWLTFVAEVHAREHRRRDGALPGGRAGFSGIDAPPGSAERGKKTDVWTPPALQANSLTVRHEQVSCCNVSGLCCGRMAAGLDEIRGRLPIIRASSKLSVFFGLYRPRSDRSCHHVKEHHRSSWNLRHRGQWLWICPRRVPFNGSSVKRAPGRSPLG